MMAKDICNTHAYTHTYIYTEKDRPPPQIDMTDATGGGHICSTLKWIERYTVHRRVSTDIIYIRRQRGWHHKVTRMKKTSLYDRLWGEF